MLISFGMNFFFVVLFWHPLICLKLRSAENSEESQDVKWRETVVKSSCDYAELVHMQISYKKRQAGAPSSSNNTYVNCLINGFASGCNPTYRDYNSTYNW